MIKNVADWFIGGLFIAFLFGVILFAYYEIRSKTKW